MVHSVDRMCKGPSDLIATPRWTRRANVEAQSVAKLTQLRDMSRSDPAPHGGSGRCFLDWMRLCHL